MPIYEFYCRDCHTLYSFFSNRVGVRKPPACPECDRARLERRPSTFAMIKPGSGDTEEEDELFAGLDETRMEQAMETLATEMDRLGDTEDPKALSQLFRRFGELTGLELGPRMEEAMRRMEAGEDLDAIEEEMDFDEDDDNLDELFTLKKKILARRRKPRVDETLHFL